MPKFETLDSTTLNEAIRNSFTEREFRNHPFDKDCSDMILRTSMEKLSMKNLIPQAEYILQDMLEENLTSSEAVAFFLHALTERKRQNYCMMQLQLARFPSNCSIESFDFSRVNEKKLDEYFANQKKELGLSNTIICICMATQAWERPISQSLWEGEPFAKDTAHASCQQGLSSERCRTLNATISWRKP